MTAVIGLWPAQRAPLERLPVSIRPQCHVAADRHIHTRNCKHPLQLLDKPPQRKQILTFLMQFLCQTLSSAFCPNFFIRKYVYLLYRRRFKFTYWNSWVGLHIYELQTRVSSFFLQVSRRKWRQQAYRIVYEWDTLPASPPKNFVAISPRTTQEESFNTFFKDWLISV
jgi:hypothetical protein